MIEDDPPLRPWGDESDYEPPCLDTDDAGGPPLPPPPDAPPAPVPPMDDEATEWGHFFESDFEGEDVKDVSGPEPPPAVFTPSPTAPPPPTHHGTTHTFLKVRTFGDTVEKKVWSGLLIPTDATVPSLCVKP